MNGEPKRYPLIYVLIIVLIVVAGIEVAWGQDPFQSNDMNTQTSGNIGGDSNLALGFGGSQFDVDIAQCMGSASRSFVFGLFAQQRLQENYWCHAITLANAGYIEAAEFMLCKHTVLSEMGSDCPGDLLRPTKTEGTLNRVTEEIERVEKQSQDQLSAYRMEITDLTTTVQTLEAKPAQIVYRMPPEIQAQIDAAEDRRARAKMALNGEN